MASTGCHPWCTTRSITWWTWESANGSGDSQSARDGVTWEARRKEMSPERKHSSSVIGAAMRFRMAIGVFVIGLNSVWW
jgi:hypothetical protein